MKSSGKTPDEDRGERSAGHHRVDLETWIRTEYERIEYRMHALLGRRALTIALMAVVLGLSSADLAALGAMASALEKALAIRNAAFGLISTASALAGALMCLPFGVLVDRKPRIPLLSALTFLWSIGMALSGITRGYDGLLLAQVVAGISGISLSAVIASLTGDYFPPSQRGRIYGMIVGGELLGAGVGLLLASLVMEAYSWRAAFWVLACLGIVCGWLVLRFLHEPNRSGMNAISRESVERRASPDTARRRVSSLIESLDISPHAARIIDSDPTYWSWGRAARYILTIRTNLILLLCSTAGYFYLNGLLTFAVLYLMLRYGLASGEASVIVLITGSGALAGVLLSGWLGDRLLGRRIVAARVWVAAAAFLIAVIGFLPAFLLPELLPASAFFFLAALGLGATNPSLDAARLDIMHSRLWGRAESLRNTLRFIPVAASPYIFGVLSDIIEPHAGSRIPRSASGLGMTFLLMLILLLISGAVAVIAALTYPRDVATTLASERASAMAGHSDQESR